MGHPYHPENNVQGFNGNPASDEGPDLNNPHVREHQAAYLRQVVDTVNDLDNVLYEVTNEGGNKDWDWWVVRTVQEYEQSKPKQHPVGLTGHGSESNEEMLASPSAWFSPGSNGWDDLKTDRARMLVPSRRCSTRITSLVSEATAGGSGSRSHGATMCSSWIRTTIRSGRRSWRRRGLVRGTLRAPVRRWATRADSPSGWT